jgi:hypothetical protein
MSLISSANVTKLSNARLRSSLPAYYPGGLVDQFIRKLCFHKMERWTDTLIWNRASNMSDLVGNVAAYDQGTYRMATALDFSDSESRTFWRFGDFLEIDAHQDPALCEDQLRAKKAAVVRKLGDQVLNGVGTTDLKGLAGAVLTSNSQTHKPTSGVPTLLDWDLLAWLVRPSDGMAGSGPDCYVCHWQMWKHLVKLIRAAGGTPEFQYDSVLGVNCQLGCRSRRRGGGPGSNVSGRSR